MGRERKLNAQDANTQLAAIREKLSLEREAAAALESRLSDAGKNIALLQRDNDALRATAASATAAAVEAATRPAVAEMASQVWLEVASSEAQRQMQSTTHVTRVAA